MLKKGMTWKDSLSVAPAGIINAEAETITAVGAIISDIPCVDKVDIELIKTGMQVRVDGSAGLVEIP